MNIVYIAPMFHTNQVPIVKGWLAHGHQVHFICQYQGKTENHADCVPYVLGYSGLFKVLKAIHSGLRRITGKLSAYPEAFQDKCGFPPVLRLSRYLKRLHPDLVILRERSMYSIVAYRVCRLHKISCILYNQTPLWDNEPPRNDFAHKIVKSLTPSVRMTPVYGSPDTGCLDKQAVYIPFVIEPHLPPEKKTYFQGDRINLLCVGKFENRKHHLMLLEILTHLLPVYPLHLALVGEVSTQYHKNYLSRVEEYIAEHHLEEHVSLYTNCKPDRMPDFYTAADFFILPSTGEFASISQLEAMSYSLPVIVSDTNGTSCYIEEGKNGYLFQDKNITDLEEKIVAVITDRTNITRMGACSYRLVTEKYSFAQYQEKIMQFI